MAVIIKEEEVKSCKSDDHIIYPGISSCLTITIFGKDKMVGAHANLMPQKNSPAKLLEQMLSLLPLKQWDSDKDPRVIGCISKWTQITGTYGDKIKHVPNASFTKLCTIGGFDYLPEQEDCDSKWPKNKVYEVRMNFDGKWVYNKHF